MDHLKLPGLIDSHFVADFPVGHKLNVYIWMAVPDWGQKLEARRNQWFTANVFPQLTLTTLTDLWLPKRRQVSQYRMASNKGLSESDRFWTHNFCCGTNAVISNWCYNFLTRLNMGPQTARVKSCRCWIDIKYQLNNLSTWVGSLGLEFLDFRLQ